ncbi:hypothetical protein BJX64DRAFT_20655 [Aspergillus heterothallicus]
MGLFSQESSHASRRRPGPPFNGGLAQVRLVTELLGTIQPENPRVCQSIVQH